ncbi:Transglycosylase SLT domain protein [Paraliobacillus sp. PM-2]|uniref:transglycosylase SLT domain-containing protein n=1 Tax=Paraliobacillus sp. PM-2 TaxID=1462524 RepID=UPI00061BE1CD|nr:transglycosylase SLT domain-containing protein [Paraliobacillus sp. PM-2]CQR46864.1 Transglycosylase SLT domain protein [Paraliobacillus sp. PM-2]
MRKDFTVALLGIVSITVIILLISLKQYSTQIDALTKENEQLSLQTQKLESEINFSKPKTIKSDQMNYATWGELENIATSFSNDSEGAFKKSWGIYLVNESKKHELDPYLIYELLKVETGGTFDPKLVGPETKYGHAYGMSQFMKNTAPWIANMADLPYDDELLFDPYYSIKLSIVYLDFLHQQYNDWNEALTAYHRGMAGMEAYKQANGSAKSNYAIKIQSNAETHRTVAFAN